MEKIDLEVAAAYRRLLRSRYIIRSRNEKNFRILIENRKRLQEMVDAFGAHLEINEPLGVAHLRPQSDELEESLGIRLSRRQTLSPFASALLLHLRWKRLQFYLQPTGDEVCVIGLLEMREFLQHLSRTRTDSQFERQFRRALDDLIDLQVLLETQAGSGIWEITGLCDVLLPVERIHELRTRAEAFFIGQAGSTEQMIDSMTENGERGASDVG